METTAVQQIHSEVNPVEELMKPCQEMLSAEQIKNLKKTLQDYHDAFAQNVNNLGQTSFIQHQINTGNHSKIKQAPRRVPLAKCEEMESLIKSMKEPTDVGNLGFM